MPTRLKGALAVIATALMLVYAGTASLSDARGFAPFPGNLAWLGLAAFVCGALVAFTNDRAIVLMAAAAVLATALYGGLWTVIFWLFLDRPLSLIEIFLSDFVFVYFVQRGAILLGMSLLAGLLGVVLVMVAQIFLPERYRP